MSMRTSPPRWRQGSDRKVALTGDLPGRSRPARREARLRRRGDAAATRPSTDDRVDGHAAVLDDQELGEPDRAGAGVDDDHGQVTGVGEGAGGSTWPGPRAVAAQARVSLWAWNGMSLGQLGDGDRALSSTDAADALGCSSMSAWWPPAAAILRSRLATMLRAPGPCRLPPDYDRAAAQGTEPKDARSASTLAQPDLVVGRRGGRRLFARTVSRPGRRPQGPGGDDDLAGRVDPDQRSVEAGPPHLGAAHAGFWRRWRWGEQAQPMLVLLHAFLKRVVLVAQAFLLLDR